MDFQNLLGAFDWQKTPLVPVVVQDSRDFRVLMLAYANLEALELSLKSGFAHYFSRSKQRIWKKGEQSGNTQKIHAIYADCDNDALLYLVSQTGAACHTGNLSCFYKKIAGFGGGEAADSLDSRDSRDSKDSKTSLAAPDSPLFAAAQTSPQLSANLPYHALDVLYHTLQERKNADPAQSYSAKLFAKGANTIGKKIAEEAAELGFAIKDNDADAVIYECADLFYHALVGLAACDIHPERVLGELKRRFGVSGIAEKNARSEK